jgi:hypothetical protein
MFALNSGAWPVALQDPAEIRDRYHRIALREARIAAESHPRGVAAMDAPRSLVDRVRAAMGLADRAPDCVGCGA